MSHEVSFSYTPAQMWMFFGSRAKGNRRIFPKGRRLGATRGAAQAMIENMLDGRSCLWGDTVNGNINRYVERYFETALKANGFKPGVDYRWRERDKVLEVGKKGGFTDFRSADRPENWEGFGYHHIFLNEAGIILANEDLYQNSVYPMLIDYPDSELICAGTPKGKVAPSGEHTFYTLWNKALKGEKGFYGRRFTTRDNTFLDKASLNEFINSFPEGAPRDQEIEGLFVDVGDSAWSMFPRSWLERAFQRYRDLEESGMLPEIDALGVDCARGGSDNSVIAPSSNGNVIHPLRLRPGSLTPDGDSLATWVHHTFPDVGDARVDIIGIGSSPFDALKKLKTGAIPMHANNTSKVKDRNKVNSFVNKRAEWYWHLREMLEHNEIAIAPDETLAKELGATFWKLSARGIQVDGKKEIKARLGGKSPDRADACVYSVANTKNMTNSMFLLFG